MYHAVSLLGFFFAWPHSVSKRGMIHAMVRLARALTTTTEQSTLGSVPRPLDAVQAVKACRPDSPSKLIACATPGQYLDDVYLSSYVVMHMKPNVAHRDTYARTLHTSDLDQVTLNKPTKRPRKLPRTRVFVQDNNSMTFAHLSQPLSSPSGVLCIRKKKIIPQHS